MAVDLPSWIGVALELSTARREGIAIKDSPSGQVVAVNDLWRRRYGDFSPPFRVGEFLSDALVEISRETDRQVETTQQPVRVLMPSPLGWVHMTKSAFRGHLLAEIRPAQVQTVVERLLEHLPALSSASAAFLVEVLSLAARSSCAEINLADLSAPRSTAGRYLRQLEALGLIRRERSGRGLRIFGLPPVFVGESLKGPEDPFGRG